MKIGERLVSRNDLHYLIELINSSLSSMSEKGIRDLIVDLGRLIPYEFTFAARFNSSSPTDSYHMVNVSYPPEWLDLYISNRFDKVDPVIREHLLNPRVQYWDDTYRKYPDARHFISLSHDFGLKAGYSCGLRSHDGTTMSLFSLSARSMECHPRTRLILSYALPVLDLCLARVWCPARSGLVPQRNLSARETEILKWAGDGKSRWEISVILHVGNETVKWHVKNILRKLNAVNTTQAVAIAIERGFINIL